jgi:hypothetical protein
MKNLVNWNPRVSDTGDDFYNLPGAVKLDTTQDTGNPSRIDAGDYSGFDVCPTIAQLNASSGVNQVIGAYNRRAYNFASSFGLPILAATNTTPIIITMGRATGPSTYKVYIAGCTGNTGANGAFVLESTGGYTYRLVGSVGNGAYTGGGRLGMFLTQAQYDANSAGTYIEHFPYVTDIQKDSYRHFVNTLTTGLQNKIDKLRTAEGFPLYSWNNAAYGLAINKKIKGIHLAWIRKSLALSGVLTLPTYTYGYFRKDNPYNTLIAEELSPSIPQNYLIFGTGIAGIFVGKRYLAPLLYRSRYLTSVCIPEYANTGTDYTAKFSFYSTSITNTEGFVFNLYSSNTQDFPPTLASASNTNNVEAAIPQVAGAHYEVVDMSETNIATAAGKYFSMITATDKEVAGTGAGTATNFMAVNSTNGPILKLDFGT